MASGNEPNNLGQAGGIWSALLDFATRIGSTDLVNQTPSIFHRMSDEVGTRAYQDREFLANAMASHMRESDPVRHLKQNMDVLVNMEYGNPSEDEQEQGVAALERIIDLCCSLDLATDFFKLGGFRVLVPLLASSASTFREHAAQLIGELAQNHPYCQNALRKARVLSVLLQLMDLDPANNVKTKALFAVSCLIRNNQDLQDDFVELDGFSFLLRAAKSDYQRMSVKACFLLSSILEKQENKDKAIESGFVEQLAKMLNEQTESHVYEQTAAALLALVNENPKAVEKCRNPELGLEKSLKDRLNIIGPSDAAAQEERSHIKSLLELIQT